MHRYIFTLTAALLMFSPCGFSWPQSTLPQAPQIALIENHGLPKVNASALPMSEEQPDERTILTRNEAEQIALKNNPRVSAALLLALAQHQVVRQTRAALMPNMTGNLTAVEANDGSRLSSGSLTASRLLEHAGLGAELSQLITDFGRTHNLIEASKLDEKSQEAGAEATRQQIIVATDYAFYSVLEAQATLGVAQQTVKTRQALVDQITELAKNKLKSDLDLSFVEVNLSQAKLLELDAETRLDDSSAALTAILGGDKDVHYQLVDNTSQLPPPPIEYESLLALAMQQRPDLQALEWKHQSAEKFVRAQADQLLPSLNATGVVGRTPVGSSQYFSDDWYGAVGANLNIPIFNGFKYMAQTEEAKLRAKADTENVRDLHNNITRDVRRAWLEENAAYQKLSVTQQLLHEANLGLDLAQTRYQLGLSSVVELSQAQLQQTEAAIGDANARYQYQFARAQLAYQTGTQP